MNVLRKILAERERILSTRPSTDSTLAISMNKTTMKYVVGDCEKTMMLTGDEELMLTHICGMPICISEQVPYGKFFIGQLADIAEIEMQVSAA